MKNPISFQQRPSRIHHSKGFLPFIHLLFEKCKLQFIWQEKGNAVDEMLLQMILLILMTQYNFEIDISLFSLPFPILCWWYWMLYNCERKRSMKSGTFCSLLEIRYFQTLYWKKWLQSTAFLLQSRTITQTIDLLSYLFTEKDIKTHCSNTLDQGYCSEST